MDFRPCRGATFTQTRFFYSAALKIKIELDSFSIMAFLLKGNVGSVTESFQHDQHACLWQKKIGMPNFCQLGNRQAVYKCNIQQTGRGGKNHPRNHPKGKAYHGSVFPLCHHITLSCRMLPTLQLFSGPEQEGF